MRIVLFFLPCFLLYIADIVFLFLFFVFAFFCFFCENDDGFYFIVVNSDASNRGSQEKEGAPNSCSSFFNYVWMFTILIFGWEDPEKK